jgi:hypothetical protein
MDSLLPRPGLHCLSASFLLLSCVFSLALASGMEFYRLSKADAATVPVFQPTPAGRFI